MDCNVVADKLKRVLYKVSDRKYRVSSSDDIYLQKLISLLTKQAISLTENDYILSICMEWLRHVTDVWNDEPLHSSVASFTLQLAGMIVGDSSKFKVLQCAGIFDRFLSTFKLQTDQYGFVTMAYISLLSELVEHDDGRCWIMETDVWWRVIKSSQECRSVQVCRESHKFISKLVVKLQFDNDTDGCKKILSHILQPLWLAKINSQDGALKEDDKNLLMASLPYLCSVFEAVMSGTHMIVTLIVRANLELESLIWQLVKLMDDEVSIGRCLKILVLLYFLFFKKGDSKIPMIEIFFFKAKLFEVITYLVAKGYVKTVLYICFECQMYFQKFGMNSVKFEEKSKLYEFRDQMFLFQTMPFACYIREYNTTKDVFEVKFIQKLFDMSCEDTIRVAYLLKDCVMSDHNKYAEHTKIALIYILQMGKSLDKELVGIMCQGLTFTLKSFAITNTDYVVQHSDLLAVILDGLSILLDSFQISWRESVACTDLFSYIEVLLKNSTLTSTLTVKALRLMQVTVRNNLPPNLALLVNTMGGSSIQELGPLVHRHLHDVSWDVRDSALELLQTVTEISHVRFPAFQDHIMENDLCSLTLSLAMDDDESYVRASALKCLAAMLKVSRYWDDCLSSKDLPRKMISVLSDESEGIVRKEAAQLMKEMIYLHNMQKLVEHEVFPAMVSAATCDLYWEVKVNALCFWEKVIEQQMGHQGMIDGRFPSVTFSKENRKIVTLTRSEVKLRINKALEELGRLGCLQVLLSAIYDCDLQVVIKAVAITTSLSSLLFQYDILPVGGTTSLGDRDDIMLSAHDEMMEHCGQVPSKDDAVLQSDRVIENIINESDISLLSEVYHSQMIVSDASSDRMDVPTKVKDFLSALSTINLQDLVSERTQWIDNCSENLNCLLDDILFTHGDPENIITDCY